MAVKDESGFSEGTIAVSAFRAYRNAFFDTAGQPEKTPDWDDLDEDQQLAWFSVAELALEMIEDFENLPWATFARSLFGTWARRIEYPIQEFRELTMPVQAAWVAVARHIANLCALQDAEDLASHEERWIGAANRLGSAMGA